MRWPIFRPWSPAKCPSMTHHFISLFWIGTGQAAKFVRNHVLYIPHGVITIKTDWVIQRFSHYYPVFNGEMNYLNCVILSATVVIHSDLTYILILLISLLLYYTFSCGLLVQSSSEVMSWMVPRPVTLVQTDIPRNAMWMWGEWLQTTCFWPRKKYIHAYEKFRKIWNYSLERRRRRHFLLNWRRANWNIVSSVQQSTIQVATHESLKMTWRN